MDIFFVISGFVITAMLLREISHSGSIRLRRFYARRILRLTPALGVMVGVTLLAGILLLSPFGSQAVAAQTGLAAVVSLSNAAVLLLTGGYFEPLAEGNPFLHTWSLSVEEQFYLVFPALMLLALRMGRKKSSAHKSVTIAVAIVTLISFLCCMALVYGFPGRAPTSMTTNLAYYSPFSRAWEFGVGSLAALFASNSRPALRIANPMQFASLVLVLIAAFEISPDDPFPGLSSVIPIAATGLLLVTGVSSGSTLIGNLLSHRVLVWIGDRSYSWYLWHWPFVVYSKQLFPGNTIAPVIASFIAVIPASWSYSKIERRYRQRRTVSSRRTAKTIGVTVASSAALASILILGSSLNWGIDSVHEMKRQIAPLHLDASGACGTRASASEMSGCTFNETEKGHPILLLDDSSAGQFSEPVVEAGRILGSPVHLETMSACPMVNADITRQGVPLRECRAFRETTLRALKNSPPSTVVFSVRSDAYLNDSRFVVNGLSNGTARQSDQKAKAYGKALGQTLRHIENAGHVVLLVTPTPRFLRSESEPWSALNCPTFLVIFRQQDCGMSESFDEDSKYQRLANLALNHAEKQLDSQTTSTLNLRDELCGNSTCSTNQGRHWLNRDGSHLTVETSTRYSDEFARAIREASKVLNRDDRRQSAAF